METLRQCLAVGVAGFFGALARLWLGRLCGILFANTSFPVGTMVINLSGSLFLGWFLTVAGTRLNVSEMMQKAVAIGFVGAYTTFSTFMYESSKLIDDGSTIQATVNLVGSLVLGLIAVRFGIWLAGR